MRPGALQRLTALSVLFGPWFGAAAAAADWPIPEGEVYLTVRSGVSFPDDQRFTGAVRLKEAFDSSSWHIGGAVGYALRPAGYGRWRLELETVRFNDDLDALRIDGLEVPFRGDSIVNTIMFNAFLDLFGGGERLTPYLGFGLGGAQIYPRLRYPPFELYDKDNTFAYQAMAGLHIPLSRHWSIQADIRYFGTANATLDRNADGLRQRLRTDYQTLVLAGGVTFTF